MIGGVPAPWAPFATRLVLRIVPRQTAQSARREQIAFHALHHVNGALSGQDGMRKAHGKNLIRPDGSVAHFSIDDVEETSGAFVPEQLAEALLCAFRHRAESSRGGDVVPPRRKVFHGSEGVVPERLNLDRHTPPRSNHVIA